MNSVYLAGGIPVILAQYGGEEKPADVISMDEQALALLKGVNGLILTGGGDIVEYKDQPPGLSDWLFGVDKARDAWEFALIEAAIKTGRPIFGICRGLQVMNRHFGGTLYRDIGSEVPGSLNHKQATSRDMTSHLVKFEGGSRIGAISGSSELKVNTGHHQAPKDPAPDFLVTGRAPDGIIEAMEHVKLPFALGVQWHPEGLAPKEKPALNLFAALVEAARKGPKG
jgi:putative glutamine amidotransferase